MSGQSFDPHARRAARLAAVQALYQMELSQTPPATAVADYLAGRLPLSENGPLDTEADIALFRQIVEGAVAQQREIDTQIAKKLAAGWRLERLDAVARAILRAGVVELWARPDVPTAVVIAEYIEIAKAFFFEEADSKFIHAALDAVAGEVRGRA